MSTNPEDIEIKAGPQVRAVVLLLAVSIAGVAGCGAQPKVNCQTSTAPFAMKLIMQGPPQESAPGACANFGPASFNLDPEVGFVSYYALDAKGQPDYSKGSVAIQTTEIGTLAFTGPGGDDANTATDGKRYSLGPYSVKEPDAAEICTVPTLAPTHLELPAVPDDPATPDDESAPPVDIRLVWSNVRVYVTAASFGTQIQADLVDTRLTPAGASCTTTYTTLSLAPAVSCRQTDADGNPIVNTDGTYAVDPTLCDPEADPAAGRFTGSGISPNTDYVCTPESGFCIINGDTIPALR